jgi:hypothetical protein
MQPIAVGIDPGSKKEALVVKSAAHTYPNIPADAITWVKDAVTARAQMRRARRFRKTPCRQPRAKRGCARRKLPPSTKARWQWKLRVCRWLCRLYPITAFIVEDIKAATNGQRCWDRSFSPLEVGKQRFYQELDKLAPVQTRHGWETRHLRDQLGLVKSKQKLAETFSAYRVVAWALAWAVIGGQPPADAREPALAVCDPVAVAPSATASFAARGWRPPLPVWRHAQPYIDAGDVGATPQVRAGPCGRDARWAAQFARHA